MQNEAYLKCKKEGKFIYTEGIDKEKIRSTLIIAEADAESANLLIKNIQKESKQWSSVYKLYYDAMHELAESFLGFDKVKIDNHQCMFAYLCGAYKQLEFNWDFFEKIRTKRNGINYYGLGVTFEDWKEVELQFKLHINKLKKEIDRKLNEIEKA